MNREQEIEDFLKAIESGFSGLNPKTFWPLNAGQIDSYFDVDEALDMYYRLVKLKEKFNIKEISDLMPPPDVIRIFLQHNAIVGLKESKELGIDDVSIKGRVDYILFLFDILKQKVRNYIFCGDGKNLILSQEEVEEILQKSGWNKPVDEKEKKKVAFLNAMGNNLAYTLFYDTFVTGGFYIHGAYDARDIFGEGAVLVVRDYHDLNPTEIWPDLEMPFSEMKIFVVYKDLYFKLDFMNHPITIDTVSDKLIAYKVFIDDKEIKIDSVDEVIGVLSRLASNQSKKINSLSDLDKVRKAAEISYYLFRNLGKYIGDDWEPPKMIEETIDKFGEKFIEEFRYKEIPDMRHWRRLFDPRDDYN
ncbi:MAG: hypothetical protein KJ718_05925 [Nanoarchaeota archaeon]|nr:hypothetical protein [Nanoarchaeota archaeon]MBU1052060.1 hypothetical protein [Nanoarchaeota archaeon]MBU1988537.1 hypothetical protein [Nanoarchaeota archaeon]